MHCHLLDALLWHFWIWLYSGVHDVHGQPISLAGGCCAAQYSPSLVICCNGGGKPASHSQDNMGNADMCIKP